MASSTECTTRAGRTRTYTLHPVESFRIGLDVAGFSLRKVMFAAHCPHFLPLTQPPYHSQSHVSVFLNFPLRFNSRVVIGRLGRLLTFRSWDDWVPEDRLRKLSPENRELANNLRHEMLAAQRAARAQHAPTKKKAQGSTRGSEERQTSVTAAPRGQKRVRDNDLEKVFTRCHSIKCSFHCR